MLDIQYKKTEMCEIFSTGTGCSSSRFSYSNPIIKYTIISSELIPVAIRRFLCVNIILNSTLHY
jgi:hypothetical protein